MRLANLSSRADRRDDEGFSVVEVAIAIAIFALVATFLSQMLAGGLKGVLLGKRREIATQEASRTLEIARSLRFNDIGLVSADPTINTDPAIQTQAGRKSYRSDDTWEPVVWAVSAVNHPFLPHVLEVERGATSLTRYVYVTGVDSDGDDEIDMKRISVRVTWDDSGSHGPRNSVLTQTLINEDGLLVTGPGAGSGTTSGLTPMKANAYASGGSLALESAIPLLGLSTPVTVVLPNSTGTSTFRAVSNTSCTTKSIGVNVLDALEISGGAATVTADDDARSATLAAPAAASGNGVLDTAPIAGALLGNSITAPVTCSAAATPLPTETGSGSILSLNAGKALGGLLGTLNVATVQTLPVTQTIEHEIASGGVREIEASAQAGVASAQVLRLPTIANGLVSVDALSYGATVRASEGTPTQAPSISPASLTVRVFDPVPLLGQGKLGAGCTSGLSLGPGIAPSRSGSYCRYVVTPNTNGFTGASIPVSSGISILGVGLLTFDVNVDILAPAVSPVAGEQGENGERRWSAEYSPIDISASLNIAGLGKVNVALDLGSVQTEACAGPTCL